MSRPPLWRIDAAMMPAFVLREAAGRFLLFFLLGGYLLSMVLSGGMNRYLSERWGVTAMIRPSVSAAEAEQIAKKAAALPGVRSAAYKDPESSWKEFLEAYPGMEALRAAGPNPLPGYVEIRIRHDRFDEGEIRSVEAALKPLPEVEKVLSGAESLPALLHASRWANFFFQGGFAMLCAVVFAVLFLQERDRASFLSADFDFLRERGIPSRSIALSRAAGTAAICGFLALAAAAASAGVYFLLESRFPQLRGTIGPPGDILTLPVLAPLAAFAFASAVFAACASLLGWRAAMSRRK